jgi:hypothetical protein
LNDIPEHVTWHRSVLLTSSTHTVHEARRLTGPTPGSFAQGFVLSERG